MNKQTLDSELQDDTNQQYVVQDIVDIVYPHIVKNLGPSKYVNQSPTVELWNDIYARLSSIPEMRGEASSTSKSEHDDYGNMIYIYYPNMKNVGDVIKALLHEYTHSLQDPTKKEENRALGYENDPNEIESRAAELNWEDYLVYLKDNEEVNSKVSIGDTVKIIETKLKSKSDLLNEILLVIGFEDDGTPVTINESDTLLESINSHPTTINLVKNEFNWVKDKCITEENTTKEDLIKKFLKSFWPQHRSQLYSKLYNTYHPSGYEESFNRPGGNFEDAVETVADAVYEGKKLGLLDSSVDWSDIVHYDDNNYSTSDLRLIDDNGIPTLNNKLEILDNTNLDWIHGILLFDVLEEIVDEFKHYCGENGIDESGTGKCMDEFPPAAVEGTNKPENSGTLKQDYYTLFNFMKELERAGIPVTNYLKDPTYPNIIKLVDTGYSDYDEEGKQRKKYALIDKIIDDTIAAEKDQDDIDAEEIAMDTPDRIEEQMLEYDDRLVVQKPGQDPRLNRVLKTIFRLMGEGDDDMSDMEVSGDRLNTSVFNFRQFWHVLAQYFSYPDDGQSKETARILWLILNYNNEMFSGMPETLKIPELLFRYHIKYKTDYSSYQTEEECDDHGVGEESGEDCDCLKAVKYVEDADGNEEEVECTDEWNDDDNREDCECENFDYKDVEVFFWPLTEVEIVSFNDVEVDYDMDYDSVLHNLGDGTPDEYDILYEHIDDYELEEDAVTWSYFSDNEEGDIHDFDVDNEDNVEWYIDNFLKNLLGTPPQKDDSGIITEQDEQLNLFPTGEWEFPVGWEEDDDYISDVKHNVPEHVFKKIMMMWDKDGIDFTIFKLLGVRPETVTNTYVLKRYIQNTTKPIPVSYTFDCNDLKELFDRNNNDYDLSYIPAYLCGDDNFWDHEDWYNYEWDEYMTDAINESNWKTISEIFGGVPQSVAEDILNKSYSCKNCPVEEIDELIEKYEEEIDEIQNYIVWAYNDENEYALKNVMAKDIEDKLAEHFQHEGQLHTDNEGSKSWTIEGDLRDYVNEQWDNTDTFEYHTDHVSQPLEDMMLDYTMGNNLPYAIFSALMEEEYAFWEYCEGKQGECLQPETKWFDGYWHPDVDINESLADRLAELTYEPTVTTPEGETKPLHEHDAPQKGLNPDVQEGDVIKLIYLNDPWANMTPGTLGVVMGFESTVHGSDNKDKILVNWIIGKDKFEKLPILKDVDTYMLSNRGQFDNEIEQLYDLKEQDDLNRDYNPTSAETQPLNKLELSVIKMLHRNLTQDELYDLTKETPSEYGFLSKRFWDVMKLFGKTPGQYINNAKMSTYAKLAYDNWTEDGNYEDLKNPIRTPLNWYVVHKDETGTQVEYKTGNVTVAAFDEDGAETKAGDEFYDWGGDMETVDWGDYESEDDEITAVEYDGVVEQSMQRYIRSVQKLLEQKQNKKIDEWLDEKPMTLNEVRVGGEEEEKEVDSKGGYEEHEPFTRTEVVILNHIIKNFTVDELNDIWKTDDSNLSQGLTSRWVNTVKLFGIPTEYQDDEWAFSTRFARWAVDNHKEAQGEDFDDDSIDYSRVGTAIKAYPSMYEVEGTNSYWQSQTDVGQIDIAAYDSEDAEAKAFDSWWDYDPDMETVDWGDQDDHELSIDDVHHTRVLQTEESDVFGQGLLDPIDPEEFEGDEEEWEKLVKDVEDDEPEETGPIYDYQGGKTDPSKGFVAPSAEVTYNICQVKGFCSAQGPITFGQLKALVEEATKKRIQADIGRGAFKTLWRLVPFFIPQILLAAVGITVTRAFNKIITPSLKDTGGYKSWWGKVVLKAMDVAEGDYIPDVAIGDDPLSKIFFISDGLLQMIRDKYKLKFARYVSDVATAQPDNKPVPEWFVENLLRDYLNQKFLLDPPLPIKKGVTEDKEQIEESKNPFGLIGDDWKEQILQHEEQLSANEVKYKKLADQLDRMTVTIPVDIDGGEEPVIGTTDITFTLINPNIFQGLRKGFLSTYDDDYVARGNEPIVIKYDLVFMGVEPGSLLEELLEEDFDEVWEGLDARERLMELLMQEGYSINESLMKEYFKLYGITIGRLENMYDSRQLKEQDDSNLDTYNWSQLSLRKSGRDNWQDDDTFSKETHDDTKLSVSSEVLIKYLDTNHRENFIKKITPLLECIIYNCYEGWMKDPDNEWDDEDTQSDEVAQTYCNECGEELNDALEKLDHDLLKVGVVTPEPGADFIKKPFPFSYNLWVDGVVKDINPRFYVDSEENISYREDRKNNQLTEQDDQIDRSDEVLPDGTILSRTPFTQLEVRILNTLHKYLSRSQLQSLQQDQPSEYSDPGKNFWSIMKLFGMIPEGVVEDTRLVKYAKWAYDNWSVEGDYGNIENPIKAQLGWYDVDIETSGSQIEYKDGTTEVLGFDEDDASDRAKDDWYSWGGDMETIDYGDYEEYDSNITRSDFIRNDEGLGRPLDELISEHKKYSIDKSNIEGEGIFATCDIKKGEFIGVPISDENKFAEFVSTRNDKLDTRSDLAKKLNHQTKSNSIIKSEKNNLNMYANNNIKKGEEITVDYNDSPWYINKDITGFKENVNEHENKQPKINPELEVDDIIRVIEVEDGFLGEKRPETFDVYRVVGKGGGGVDGVRQRYNLIKLHGEQRSWSQNRTYTIYHGDTWIYADETMASKVDRLTLTEHKEPGLNPDLVRGDIIRVIEVKDEGRPNKPERGGVYKVRSKGMPPIVLANESVAPWYEIVLPDDDVNSFDYVIKRIYWGDTWIYADTPMANSVDRLTLSEHGADTSWGDDDEKVTLQEILELTKDIPIIPYPTKELAKIPSLKKLVLGWEDNNPEEIERISQVEVSRQYPILVMVNEYNEIQWILDGNHRAQQALINDIPTIPAKLIKPSDLDERSIKIFYPEGIPDTENLNKLTESLTEHEEPGLNPELEVGDIIRIIDIDREMIEVRDERKYNIPSPELRPEMFVSYEVVDKESNGHKSKWPWRYTLVPEGEIEITGRNPYGEVDTNVKLLYPWIYQWIFDNTPTASKVDRLTLTEHKQPEISPELEVDDIIRVIEIDGEHANMPQIWGIYKVHDVKQDNVTQEFYYELSGETSEVVQDSTFSTTRLTNTKYLYHGDTWIYADAPPENKVDRLTITEDKNSKVNPELMIGDEILVVSTEGIHDFGIPELYKPYVVVGISYSHQRDLYNWTHGEEKKVNVDYGRKDYDGPIYQIELIGMTDDERTGAMLAGGGRMKPLYIYPEDSAPQTFPQSGRADQWILRPGFLRGEHLTETIKRILNEHKEELNQPLTMGDVIRVVDVDKEATYEQPTYPYDTGNASGNSLMTNHHRDQIHGQDTYPRPMRIYAVTSKSMYRTKDRDYLNPYWVLWPVDENYKVQSNVKKFREIILTEKDTWITLKKHHSNITGDIEAKHKEYVDSGRDIISRQLDEDDGYIDDMVYRDEPRDKHTRRMSKDLGSLEGFPIEGFKNIPPPSNESSETEEEIEYLEDIPVDKNLVDSADEMRNHFSNFLSTKGLEYPKEELKPVMVGVKAIILKLKYHYNRPRPWQIAQEKGLKLNSETLKSSSSPSYPSGHATQGRFVARYLADLYPEYRDELTQIGEDIAFSRNMAKVHYPSDSAFGKLLGDEMYEYVYQPEEELEVELSESRVDIVDRAHPYMESQYTDFVDFVINELGIKNSPSIRVETEPTSTYTTGYYNNKKEIVKVRGHQRQLADILRSIAHELVHHKQKEDGLIKKSHPEIGGPIEDEANSMAGRLVKTYGKIVPEIYTLLQEQYENPEESKKVELSTHLFNVLDDNFGIYPHPEGELDYDGDNMQLYSYDHGGFVPIEVLYNDIPNMVKGGIPKEDADLFINILTDWVNSRMTFKEPQLNEQTEDKTTRIRQRLMLETDAFKVVVPLNEESFCMLAGEGQIGWQSRCTDGILEGSTGQMFVREGTSYFIVSKIDGVAVLLFDRGKVPFLIDDKPSYSFYKKINSYNPWEWQNNIDLLRFMSDKPELIEFFKISYSQANIIKFDMAQSEEEIKMLAKEGGKFGEQIFNIMNNNFNEDEIFEKLMNFAGNVDIERDVHPPRMQEGEDGKVFIRDNGVTLQIEEDIYHHEVLNLDEDDVYYYEMGHGAYNDHYEELDDTEIDYIGHNFTKDTMDKWNKVMTLLGEDEFVKTTGGDFEEGDITDPMSRHLGDEWYDASSEILSELGYGIGENRAKEMKSYLDSEVIFDGEHSWGAVEIDLTWKELLYIIRISQAETFQELIRSDWNEISGGLSDVWWDGHGYDDEVGIEINRLMNNFLTKALKNPEQLEGGRKNYDKLIVSLNNLGFENTSMHDISTGNRTYWVDKHIKKQINIVNFDSGEDMIDIKVTQLIDGANYYNQYRIKPEELSNYIQSDDLFIKDAPTTVAGTWGIKYL